MNKKSPKIAAPSKQHITVGFEDTAFDEDAAVTEEVPLPLLIQLKKQLGQVERHFHVPIIPVRKVERELNLTAIIRG